MRAKKILGHLIVAGLLTGMSVAAEGGKIARSIQKLDSENPVIARRGAAEALGKIGEPAQDAVPSLVKALHNDADPGVRTHAAWALGRIKNPNDVTVPALIRAFQDEVWSVRSNAMLSLTWIGKAAVPELKAALGENSAAKRVYAASVLATLDTSLAPEIMPTVLDLLDHEIPPVRTLAIETAGRLGAAAQSAVPGLIASLDHQHPHVRHQTIEALREIGQPAASAVPRILKLFKEDKDRGNRIAGALALASLGKDNPGVVAALTAALEDKDSRVRSYSADALGRMGEVAVPVLANALNSKDPRLRNLAATALGAMGPQAQPALDTLLSHLDDPDPQVRTVVADAIGLTRSVDPLVRQALEMARDKAGEDAALRAHLDQALIKLDKNKQD